MGRAPLINLEALQATPQRLLLNLLTQESQPLEYCASQQYHFLRKVLEYLGRK